MTDRTPPDSGRIITSIDILLRGAQTALMYEELRAAIDDGHESMTHADALAEIAAIRAENAELRAQLEAIGAGGVSGPLMGKPQEMPDLSALTERGAKAWAGVDAQGLRDGVASAGSEPVARVNDDGFIVEIGDLPIAPGQKLYLHPSPPEGMVMVPIALAIDSPIRDVLITWMEKGIKGECFLYKDMWAAIIDAAKPTTSAGSGKGA